MPTIKITGAVILSLIAVATRGAAAENARSRAPATGSAESTAHADASRSGAITTQMPTRAGTIVLKVTDYDVARQQLLAAALQEGAELLNSRTEVDYRGKQHGWVRLRLAADHLPQLLP